jgi:hypothetical protein
VFHIQYKLRQFLCQLLVVVLSLYWSMILILKLAPN